jgi:hypothetical protein
LKNTGADVRIILKWFISKEDVGICTAFIGSGQGPVAVSCENGAKF